jgi:hypothetical protein
MSKFVSGFGVGGWGWDGGATMHKLLKTFYLSEVISHVCVFKWFKRFREGCDSFEDESDHCQL